MNKKDRYSLSTWNYYISQKKTKKNIAVITINLLLAQIKFISISISRKFFYNAFEFSFQYQLHNTLLIKRRTLQIFYNWINKLVSDFMHFLFKKKMGLLKYFPFKWTEWNKLKYQYQLNCLMVGQCLGFHGV